MELVCRVLGRLTFVGDPFSMFVDRGKVRRGYIE